MSVVGGNPLSYRATFMQSMAPRAFSVVDSMNKLFGGGMLRYVK